MNVLPCELSDGKAIFAGKSIEGVTIATDLGGGGTVELGIRPEFISFAAEGIPVRVSKVLDVGRHRIVETEHAGHIIKMLVPENGSIPEGDAYVRFAPERTQIYRDGWLVT